MTLAKATLSRLIREAGGERVSEGAALALGIVLEAQAKKIVEKAVVLAKHAGRKTITEEDIKLASQ